MHPLVEMANHLIATALAEVGSGDVLRVRSLTLDDGGLRLAAWLDHPRAAGEVELLLRVTPSRPETGAAGTHQTLSVSVVRWPDRLPPALEGLRKVLERAKLNLELDFS